MVSLKDVQGRIYHFKRESEYSDLGLPPLNVEDKIRTHMVLVLDIVPGQFDFVKVMTITSTFPPDVDNRDFVPISPTPKKGFAIQLRLQNLHGWSAIFPTMLPKRSYLRIDSYFEVPIQSLTEAEGPLGNPLRAWSKHQGGLKELRGYIRRRDRIRHQDMLERAIEWQNSEEGDA